MENIPQELLDALRAHRRILVTAHAQPDGDATGSSIAMAWMLRYLGKDVILYNETGFPEWLNFLIPPCPLVRDPANLPMPPELIVTLDCGDAFRAGEKIQPFLHNIPSINIDHHAGNSLFGSVANWVRPDRAATGQMVAEIAAALNVDLIGPPAEAVYVAISCDTGSFSFGNTDASVLELAANLVRSGLNLAAVREKMENTWSPAKWKLWARLMAETQILEDGKLAAIKIPCGLFVEYGAKREDLEGFPEQLRRIHGVRVTWVLREEMRDDVLQTKISLRSSGTDDVRAVAASVGGGGHRNAAGATLPLSAEETFSRLLPELRKIWS